VTAAVVVADLALRATVDPVLPVAEIAAHAADFLNQLKIFKASGGLRLGLFFRCFRFQSLSKPWSKKYSKIPMCHV
jgi:hypothetical protein